MVSRSNPDKPDALSLAEANSLFPLRDATISYGCAQGYLMEAACAGAKPYDFEDTTDTHRDIWRYIYLQRAFNRCESDDDLFDEVNLTFADFSYPEDMHGIVSFMPATEEAPSPSSLRSKIEAFLAAMRIRLLKSGK